MSAATFDRDLRTAGGRAVCAVSGRTAAARPGEVDGHVSAVCVPIECVSGSADVTHRLRSRTEALRST